MKRVWKNGLPTFAALIIFIVVQAIKMFVNISSQQEKDFETISNVAIFAVFIITFYRPKLNLRANDSGDFNSILGSMIVPVIAFLINITVFGHTIQWEHLSSDLWGWHLFWIVCIIAQALILLGWGRKLSRKISALLVWMINIYREKGLIWAVFFGIVGWGVDTGIQIFERGAFAVFSELDIFWERMWRWVVVTVILIFLIYILPPVFQKVKEVIQNMDGKKVLVIVVAVILVLSIGVISSLLKITAFIVVFPAIFVASLWLIIKGTSKIGKSGFFSVLKSGSTENTGFTTKCWMIILLAYVEIPLVFIGVVTVFSPSGRQIIMTQDPSDLATWLNLISEALKVAKDLLELLAV